MMTYGNLLLGCWIGFILGLLFAGGVGMLSRLSSHRSVDGHSPDIDASHGVGRA